MCLINLAFLANLGYFFVYSEELWSFQKQQLNKQKKTSYLMINEEI